jgi:hypothetical protein
MKLRMAGDDLGIKSVWWHEATRSQIDVADREYPTSSLTMSRDRWTLVSMECGPRAHYLGSDQRCLAGLAYTRADGARLVKDA